MRKLLLIALIALGCTRYTETLTDRISPKSDAHKLRVWRCENNGGEFLHRDTTYDVCVFRGFLPDGTKAVTFVTFPPDKPKQ